MKKLLVLIAFLSGVVYSKSYSQKRYGYTVLKFRCGDDDAGRDRVYYSPIIELNRLNFPQYTDGIDPTIAHYSVRYYNYAISKWFEIYLRDKYKILVNAQDKYARRSNTVIYNDRNKTGCNDNKTNSNCFFLDKQELSLKRKNDVSESRSPINENVICEVIDLQ